MIIPIKCFTCGMLLADKYRYYVRQVRQLKSQNEKANNGGSSRQVDRVTYLTAENRETKAPEGEVLDDLGLTKVCCRRHFLTHVDIE
jgi:DNA-directed RNA polymerase subunit N (RpoN/RPB10)